MVQSYRLILDYMSTYLYLTAEQPTREGWKLFSSMEKNQNWCAAIAPPLIIDGGWPPLARHVIKKTRHFGLPDDCSAEMKYFYDQCLADASYGIGWGMYSQMKNIRFSDLSGLFEFKSLFSKLPNRGDLRLIYWWSY